MAERRVAEAITLSPPRLGWVCTAHHAEGDDRGLGLPVMSLTWIREDSRTAT